MDATAVFAMLTKRADELQEQLNNVLHILDVNKKMIDILEARIKELESKN